MKRLVLIALAAAVVLLVAGCAFPKSYFIVIGDSSSGFCEQVTTNNPDIRSSLTTAGFQEGTCASQDFAGSHYCSFSAGSGTEIYDVSIYWGTDYSDIAATCSSMGWTYH